jgi:hypothetical protein
MAGYVLLPSLYSYLSAHIASLATSLSAAGEKAASIAIGVLKAAIAKLSGIPWYVRIKIFEVIGALIKWTVDTGKKIEEPSDMEVIILDDDPENIRIIMIAEEEAGFESGKVVFLNNVNDPNDNTEYEYRKYGGGYQVWINGEWVQMPVGWDPGDEISPPE